METRVAIVGIVIENRDSIATVNDILHEFADAVIGRMGIPYRKRNINIISIAIDAQQDTINALSGKLGKLDGVNTSVVYSKK